MRRFDFIVLMSCAAPPVVATPAAAPPMPAPYRARGAAAVALNTTCVACHAEEAAAWQVSMHRRAYDNRAFKTALAVEPSAFCRGCHAPEANPDAPTVASELGVACVTCHVTSEGTVLAAAQPRGSLEKHAPHGLSRAPEFAGTASCAGCHEFRFPGDAQLMQATMREHSNMSASPGCTSCHKSHAFNEVRDRDWLASQLRVRAELSFASGTTSARITLEQTAPGHAFPTGDLFRRLAVRVGAETRYLARHFEAGPTQFGRRMTLDDRVFDEPRVVDVPIAPLASGTREVSWSVTLERVGGMTTGSDPSHATIESSVDLHSGVLQVSDLSEGK